MFALLASSSLHIKDFVGIVFIQEIMLRASSLSEKIATVQICTSEAYTKYNHDNYIY